MSKQTASTKDIKSTNYEAYLLESLKNTDFAIEYLNSALEGGDIQVFLLSIQMIVKAQGGITLMAQKTNRSRTSLYKSLSNKSTTQLKTAMDVLAALGMQLTLKPATKPKRKKAS